MKIKKYILRILAALLILSLSQIPAAFYPVLGEEANDIKIYKLWYDSEAPQSMHGFERLSLPLGNGYMGINVFGGLESELITVTENSMFNPWTKCTSADGPFGQDRMDASAGGLNILAWTHIDFDHEGAENYRRELLLNDATAKVRYDHEGITYTRDYFTSYPDKVAVVRLTASEPGAISFTLRPEAPYCYDPEASDDYSYLDTPNDGYTKSGVVTAAGDTVTVKVDEPYEVQIVSVH